MASLDPGVVIIGGGIMGSSVAYHLARLGVRATIIERSGIAAAASGRAGGFLARDWCDGSPLKMLAQPSFDMHADMAGHLPVDVGYREVDAYAVNVIAVAATKGVAGKSTWVDGKGVRVRGEQKISRAKSAAQVDPARLTNAMVAFAASEAGTSVVIDTVTGIVRDGKRVLGVETVGRGVIRCDHVVIAMGPWTATACSWFPGLESVTASKATSIVLRSNVPPQALFCEFEDESWKRHEPEVYPRVGEVYICGSAKQTPLPSDPNEICPTQSDVDKLVHFSRILSPRLADAPVIVQQSCYLPLSPDGIPLVGRIPGTENAIVAAGHGCWGILNSPATGLGVAELIVKGKSTTIDISQFDPTRFPSATSNG